MELLNDVWMNIHNPYEFFNTILYIGILVINNLLIIPSKKQIKKLINEKEG